jgi:formylglycine-generating enzyme required for sulfatase activity
MILMVAFQFGCGRKQAESSPSSAKVELVPLTNMVLIKAGSFIRQKQPIMLMRDYWLGKYEVTQGEYEMMMGKNVSHFKGDTNRPVEQVRYADAVDYCSTLTKRETDAGRLPAGYAYRLPTEAEWEYACRAGTTNFYSFGDDVAVADQYAWTLENSEGTTHPVGLKRANPWGLHDVHGNVWEWTSDWFADYAAGPLTDPPGPAQGQYKVFRGGSWNHTADFTRSRNRFMMSPTNGINFVGFRIALGEVRKRSN